MHTKTQFAVQVEALADKKLWQDAYAMLDRAGAEAIPDIVVGLRSRNARIRRFCAALLDHNADERSLTALVRALSDEDSGVRRLAVHAVGCQRCKRTPLDVDVVALLIERLQGDSSMKVRQVTAQMLGNQPLNSGAIDPRAIAALEQILRQETNPKLRSNARWALAQHQTTTIAPAECPVKNRKPSSAPV